MDPITLSLLISAGPAILQGIQGIRQTQQGKEMQKNLGPRVNYQIPEEAKRALSLVQGLASSREMPGQAGMQYMMDLQAQKAMGNAARAATSSQDLLGVATNLGEQAQENQLNLGIQSAQNYQQRQQALYGALQDMAGYQEKVTADKQQNWYEKAQAAAAMRGAGMENTLGAMQGIASAGMQGLAMGAESGMFEKTRPSLSAGVEEIKSIGAPLLPTSNPTPTGLMKSYNIFGKNYSTIPGMGLNTAKSPGGLAPIQSALMNDLISQNMMNTQNQQNSGWQSFNNQYFMNPLLQ